MLNPLTYWIILLLVSGYALAKGSRDLRVVAAICLAASLATVLVHVPLHHRFVGVDPMLMLVDELTFAGFALVALLSQRFWPLWVAGFQLTSLLSHLFRTVDPSLLPRAYAVAERFWVYPILLFILIATYRHGLRQQGRLPS